MLLSVVLQCCCFKVIARINRIDTNFHKPASCCIFVGSFEFVKQLEGSVGVQVKTVEESVGGRFYLLLLPGLLR